jgi:hypothetical protein
LKAFFFYATPYQGSKLANLVGHVPFLFNSPLVKYLEVTNGKVGWLKVGWLDSQFEEIHQNVGKGAWKFYGVGEMHATSYVCWMSILMWRWLLGVIYHVKKLCIRNNFYIVGGF